MNLSKSSTVVSLSLNISRRLKFSVRGTSWGTHHRWCLCGLLSPGWHLALWRLDLTQGDRRVPGCAASLAVAAHRSVGAAALEGGGPWGSSNASCAGADLGCSPSREPHAAALESLPFSQKDFFHIQEEINNPPLLPIK